MSKLFNILSSTDEQSVLFESRFTQAIYIIEHLYPELTDTDGKIRNALLLGLNFDHLSDILLHSENQIDTETLPVFD